MRSKIVKFFLIALAVVAVERFCHWQTDGFRLAKVSVQRTHPFEYPADFPPASIEQKFTFLGSGTQAYAFLGEDGETILKLFKQYHGNFSTDLIAALPETIGKTFLEKRDRRLGHILGSAQIAAEMLPEGTGVIYAHLAQTEMGLGTIEIIDKLGMSRSLDLDNTLFVLQKRAELVPDRLHRLFSIGQVQEAVKQMKSLVHLIESRSMQGIKNKDGNVLRNSGFLGDQPVEIDVGSYTHRNKSTHPNPHKKTAEKASLKLLAWVEKHFPELRKECPESLYEKDS